MLHKTQARRAWAWWSARSASGNWLLALLITTAHVLPAKGPEPERADLPLKDQPHFRGPVAGAWIVENSRLAVANSCGTISVVDIEENEVIDEVPVGQRLAGIKAHPSGKFWLSIDHERHELIKLVQYGKSLRIAARHPVATYPIDLAISTDGRQIAVASLWSRKVTLFAISKSQEGADSRLERVATVALRFNPGAIHFLKLEEADYDDVVLHGLRAKLVGSLFFYVTDAFADSAAIIRARDPYTVVDSGVRLFVEERRTSYSWGGMLTLHGTTGTPDSAQLSEKPLSRIDETFLWSPSLRVPLGAAGSLSPAQRGERLFRLGNFHDESAESGLFTMTCNSCHVRGHTTYELADTLADGTTGTRKRIPTLLGTRLTDPWAWNGSFRELSEQVRSSLETTMHVLNYTPRQVADITAYLHTLPPPPPLEPATDDPADKEKLARGKHLFQELGCAKCHVPPLTYTSPDTYDVGLEDEKGLKKFNPPSLRGVSQGYSFFHDGRAKTLEEVFTVHGHQLSRVLAKSELADLLRFLRSL